MRIVLTLTLLVATTAPAVAQQPPSNEEVTFEPGSRDLPIRFENLTLEDGLTQSVVYGILQDSNGFMWFGTQLGLNRYDGSEVRRYMPDPFDSTSIHHEDIYGIEEDDDGMLWLAYDDGTVGRFDPGTGKSRNYYSSASDSTRPNAGRVTDILQDSKGRIWTGGWGVQLIDPETGTAQRWATHSGNGGRIGWTDTIMEEPEGTFIVTGQNGVFRFDPETRSIEQLFESTVGIIRAVFDPGEPDILWAGSLGGGAFRYDLRTRDIRQYDVTASPVDVVISVVPDPTQPGIVWTSTREGIVRLDAESGAYRTYRRGTSGTPGQSDLLNNAIGTIYADRAGILWASAEGSGVSRFDPTAIGFGREEARPDDPNSFTGQSVWTIYPAGEDVLWVVAGGSESVRPGWYVNRIDRRYGTVDAWQIGATTNAPILEDPLGRLLIGTFAEDGVEMSGGVYAYDERRNTLVPVYTVASGHLPDDRVREMHVDANGDLWVGTLAGLARIDPGTGESRMYTADEEAPDALHNDNVWELLEDGNGFLWVSTLRDQGRIDLATGEMKRFWDRPDAPGDAEFAFPRKIAEDLNGDIWIALVFGGSPGRIIRYDPVEDTMTSFEHDIDDRSTWSGGTVTSILPHPADPSRIYFTSYGSGVSVFDAESDSFRHFDDDDGLFDPAVYAGIFDNLEMLWLPTNSGLYRFDPETETFRRFGLEYGLQSLEFNEGVIARSANNELFFGGVQGFNAFFPSQLRANDVPPDVAITEFLLFNERVTPGPESPLKKSISDTDEVRLAHDQDAPSFRFAALHYKRPEANRIRYRLEPEQTDWIDAEGRHEASYTNLSPGEYTFRVIAANSDGVWNEEGAAVRLVITSPWWTRWWAWLIYLAILGGLVFAADRMQRRRLVQKEREAARERELEQARKLEAAHHELERSHEHLKATQQQLVEQEKMASLGSLTAGIAHEIKNPLNFVNNFAEVSSELAAELKEAVESGDRETANAIIADLLQNTDQIAKHGKRADGIVRSMMQHARGGTSEMETVDVNAFVGEYADLAWHGMRARDHGFDADVEKDLDPEAGTMTVQSQEIGRVLVNLLNNAFQVLASEDGPEKGLVRVSTRRNGRGVEIRVSDNGPGILPENRKRIFEPFFTTKSTGEGTGLGLSLSYDIVTKGHGGTLEVQESAEGGAEFVVRLPG